VRQTPGPYSNGGGVFWGGAVYQIAGSRSFDTKPRPVLGSPKASFRFV